VNFQKTHKQLKNKFGLDVSFLKEYWGEMWDSYSPENGYQNVDFRLSQQPKFIYYKDQLSMFCPNKAPEEKI